MKVGFLGLGVMGYPMAGYLVKAGHEVCVYNRTAEKAEKWVQKYGGTSLSTPAEASQNAEIVFTCVGNDDDLRQVVTGEQGAFCGMRKGTLLVDHTTTSAIVARELAGEGNSLGIGFVDAPISGGQSGAENGILTVMCGGSEVNYDRAEPVIQAYARTVKRLGEVGSGQLTKMVNQICVAGVVQSLAEAIHFAQQAGLDPIAVIEVISKGAAQSWQMENRHKTMVADEFEFGFAVDWMRKDLGIVLNEARLNRAQLPGTAMIDQFYSSVQALGGGRWDTSSLIKLLQDPK
jgi:3-hydroxyisobutyrate dehydrogenase-like beta-hydroxyacid dehydrogenase